MDPHLRGKSLDLPETPIKLLVVDDENDICNLIKSSLEQLDSNYSVEIQNSAPGALKYLISNKVDVLITDIKMPRMSGLHLLKSVSRLHDDISIVIVTAHGNLDTAIEAFRLGAVDYLEKPITVKLLHLTIQRIVSRRRMILKLTENEELFRTVFQSTPDSIHISNFNTKDIVAANESFTHLFGYENLEVRGKTFESFGFWYDPDEEAEFQTKLKNDLLVSNFRAKLKSRDDQIFTCLVSARVATLNTVPHILTVIRDVSELQLAIEAQKESEGKYSRIFQNIQDAYFEMKLDGTLLEISPSVENILQYKREEILGRPKFKIWADHAELYRILHEFKQTKKLKDCEIQLWRRDNVLLTCSINAILFEGDQDTGAKIIGSMRDISDFKRVEQQLANNQKLETIGRLAGGIAHDFNNMLTGILGYADLAKNMVSPDDPLEKYMSSIIEKCHYASETVEHLAAFSSNRKLEIKVMSLNDILQPLVTFLKKIIRGNIKFNVHLKHNLEIIQADLHAVQEIITYLCLNAESAMPNGGCIEIRSQSITIAKQDQLTRHGAAPGNYVVITISDNGVGIAPKDLQHIFEPYFTTRQIGDGQGLGLFMVFGLIKQHDGFITCDSIPDKKTTFRIYFPAYELTRETAETIPLKPIDTTNKTVLIVDDDKGVLTVVSAHLKREKFNVLIAHDGEEALALLKSVDKIDIIISDIGLPNMSGEDLYQRIRDINYDCKFIFISGYANKKSEITTSDNTAFLQKPFHSGELMETIRKLFDR